MRRLTYTLALLAFMMLYNNAYAEEYTGDTAVCFPFHEKISKGKTNKYFCFDKKTGYGITGTYKQIIDGRLDSEIPFKDGQRDGLQTWYDEKGNVKLTENYKDGKEHGITTYYRETGQIEHTEEYKNGVRDGTVTFYNEAGKVEETAVFKDGKRIK